MLVSTVNENGKYRTDDCDILLRYAEVHISKAVYTMHHGRGDLNNRQEELNLMEERNIKEKEDLKSTVLLDAYCESLLNNFNCESDRSIGNESIFAKNEAKFTGNEENNNQIKKLSRKIAVDLGWGSDEENKYNSMDNNVEISGISKSRPHPMRFSPDLNKRFSSGPDADFQIPDINSLDVEQSNGNMSVNPPKINSFLQHGTPTTSKNISLDCKMQQSADEDTTYDDDFDFGLCPNSQLKNAFELFDEKNELPLNGDLISEYENNLELEIVKNNVCLAMENYENEIFPLKSYEVENGISSWNLYKENFDNDTQESFPFPWNLDGNIEGSQDQMSDAQAITPKKTVDITKIKGWRKKQFTVEKSLMGHFDNISEMYFKSDEWRDFEELSQSIPTEDDDAKMEVENETVKNTKDDSNANYAFVCDRLDNFLAKDAELKINYEIPHLYAECGIKLTSEDLISHSKEHCINNNTFSEKDFRALKKNSTDAEVVKLEKKYKKYIRKRLKKKGAFRNKSNKINEILKNENNSPKRAIINMKNHVGNESLLKKIEIRSRRSHRILQNKPSDKEECKLGKGDEIGQRGREKTDKYEIRGRIRTPVTRTAARRNATNLENVRNLLFNSECNFRIHNIGMILYPGPFAPLNPFIQYHLRKMRSYETLIDRKWATFAVSAVYIKKKPENRRRMILPVTCCFKDQVGPATNEEESEKFPVDKFDNFAGNCVTGDAEYIHNSEVIFDSDGRSEQEIKELVEYLVNLVCKEEEVEETEETFAQVIDTEVNVRTTEFNADSKNLWTESSDEGLSNATIVSGEEIVLERQDSNSSGDCEEVCSETPDAEPSDDGDLANPEIFDLNWHQPRINYLSDVVQEESDAFFENDLLTKYTKVDSFDCSDEQESGCCYSSDHTEKSFTPRSEDLNQPAFNNIIAKLLVNKLNELKYTQNTTNSIDNLKCVKPNILELIKLNFIKENFLSGYVNIWYKKSENGTKSRAFLTFSMNPPMEGAVNLKMISRISRKGLPKIINDILARNSTFDSDDFAILFCDGKLWEIHGSVNFSARGKNEEGHELDDKIQIFHLTEKILLELKCLRDVRQTDAGNEVSKWWIMNMLQDYTEIVIKAGDEVGTLTRAKIMQTLKFKFPSFVRFKGIQNARHMGIVVNSRFWPYFLIGPYKSDDNHELTLKMNLKVVPFEYCIPLDRVKPTFLLKRFISSIIMHSWRSHKQVVEMWLYDNSRSKKSSFIEIRTRSKKIYKYEPSMEHDYSLTQTENDQEQLQPGCLHPQAKRSEDKSAENGAEKIYLVPDIPNLGYLKGELNSDQSIVIEHPLKPNRKVKSHRIGEWLNRIMKRRIRFIPNTLDVKWTVVKDCTLLEEQKPLNKFTLGGTHILCQKGLFYLLSMTREEIKNLGLNESSVLNAIADSQIIKEVTELKELGKLLLMKDECNLQMCEILQLAVSEIEKLQREEVALRKLKNITEREREVLCQKFINALQNCIIEENIKNAIYIYIKRLLQDRKEKYANQDTRSESVHCLEVIDKFLQKYINNSEEKANISKNLETEMKSERGTSVSVKPDSLNDKAAESQNEIVANGKCNNKNDVHKLEMKIMRLHELLNKCNSDNPSLYERLTARLNMLSKHLSKIKSNCKDGNKTLFTCKTEIPQQNSVVKPKLLESSSESYTLPQGNDIAKNNREEVKFPINNSKKFRVSDSVVRAKCAKSLVRSTSQLPESEKDNPKASSQAVTVICRRSENDVRVKRIVKPQLIRGSVSIFKRQGVGKDLNKSNKEIPVSKLDIGKVQSSKSSGNNEDEIRKISRITTAGESILRSSVGMKSSKTTYTKVEAESYLKYCKFLAGPKIPRRISSEGMQNTPDSSKERRDPNSGGELNLGSEQCKWRGKFVVTGKSGYLSQHRNAVKCSDRSEIRNRNLLRSGKLEMLKRKSLLVDRRKIEFTDMSRNVKGLAILKKRRSSDNTETLLIKKIRSNN